MYVRKEAVLSSQIEGTQSSLSDLLIHESSELPGALLDDIREVSNYVAALDHGLRRMKEEFPLSLRLMREIHEVLLSRGRGSGMTPGEFRRSQNWIGGTPPGNARFVPPPPERLMKCLDPFEKFLHLERTALSIPVAARKLSVSAPTVRKAVRHLEDLGIVREVTGKQRWRLFVYERYMAVLNRGTELER